MMIMRNETGPRRSIAASDLWILLLARSCLRLGLVPRGERRPGDCPGRVRHFRLSGSGPTPRSLVRAHPAREPKNLRKFNPIMSLSRFRRSRARPSISYCPKPRSRAGKGVDFERPYPSARQQETKMKAFLISGLAFAMLTGAAHAQVPPPGPLVAPCPGGDKSTPVQRRAHHSPGWRRDGGRQMLR